MRLISIHYTLGSPGNERKANGIYSIQDADNDLEKAWEYIRGIQKANHGIHSNLVSVRAIQNGYV